MFVEFNVKFRDGEIERAEEKKIKKHAMYTFFIITAVKAIVAIAKRHG